MTWLVAVALLLLMVYLYGLNLSARWRLRRIPGPKPSWLFGNLREMGAIGMHNALPQYAKKFGPVYKAFFGRYPVVVVTDPDLVKQICVKQFMTFHDRQFNMINLSGSHTEPNCTMTHGILAARGKYWASLRASCEPVFHSEQLARYAPMMSSAVEKLITRLQKGGSTTASTATEAATVSGAKAHAHISTVSPVSHASGSCGNSVPPPSINLGDALGTMTLEVIGSSAFGVAFDTEKADSRIVEAARFVMAPPKHSNNLNRLGNLLVPELGRLWFLLSSWTGSEAVRGSFSARGYLLGTAQVLLRNARAKLASSDRSSAAGGSQGAAHAVPVEAVKPGILGRLVGDQDLNVYNRAKAASQQDYGNVIAEDSSLLHHLTRANNKETGQPFTEHQIMAQGNTFLLAGYETTSTALMFAILCLIDNPAAARKLHAEVDAFDWKGSNDLAFSDLAAFPYTRAVIDEAMRLYPPVAPMVGLQREALSDTTLGGYHLPRGEKIWINVMGMHHDPSLWPDPEEFKPERFLDGHEAVANRHPYAYLPFGVGPRKCIGYKFAMEEAIITLASLSHKVNFSLDTERHPGGVKDLPLSSGATLSVKGGLWVHVSPRHRT